MDERKPGESLASFNLRKQKVWKEGLRSGKAYPKHLDATRHAQKEYDAKIAFEQLQESERRLAILKAKSEAKTKRVELLKGLVMMRNLAPGSPITNTLPL